MNTDYRVNTAFYNDIRTAKLSKRLGDSGLAALNFLWCWSAMFCVSGVFHDMTEEDIEIAAKWHGEPGQLVTVLVELHWLDKLVDGTYALRDWAETNPWAADAENRSDKARLSGMAKNYPELHKMLVAQGATGITKDEYKRLTTEYNSIGIVGKDKGINTEISGLRFASDALAPTPKPAPEPKPTTFLKNDEVQFSATAIKENMNIHQSSASEGQHQHTNEVLNTNILNEGKTVDKAEILDEPKNLNSVVNSELQSQESQNLRKQQSQNSQESQQLAFNILSNTPATIESVISLWNDKLVPAGFPRVQKLTPARGKMFVARVKADEDRKTLSWWYQLFEKMLTSDFMLRTLKEGAKWLTIDWVLAENNLVKISEGRYCDDNNNKIQVAPKPEIKPDKTNRVVAKELTPEEKEQGRANILELCRWMREHFSKPNDDNDTSKDIVNANSDYHKNENDSNSNDNIQSVGSILQNLGKNLQCTEAEQSA